MADLYPTNPSDLTGLLAQFQPSPEEQAAARKQAQMQFFLGLLGAPKGGEFERLGQSGLLAMKNYQDQIKQDQALRGQNLAQAAQLMQIMRQQQLMKTAQDIFANDNSAPQGPSMPAPGLPQGSVGGGGMGGGTPAMFGQSAQPGPVASSAPATAMQLPTWKQLMPKAAQAMALASGDPKVILDQISKYTETKMGPDGTVTTVTGVPLYRMTPQGVQFFSPQGMPADFAPFPQAAIDAEAKRSGAISGAQAAATEQAQFPYRTVTGPFGPNGAPVTGFQSQLLGNPAAPQQGGRRQVILDPSLSPQERAAALADAQKSGYPQMGYSMPGQSQGGALVGADPLAIKRQEAAINTQAEQNNVVAQGQAKDFLGIIDAEKQAPGNIAKYQLMKDWLSKVDTGKLAPSVLGLKSVASYIAPNLTKDWTKDVPYAQAVSALSNEIALQLRNPAGGAGMPGSMSDSDRNFLTSMAANTSDTPQAIQLKLDMRIALEKRSQEIGQIARAYRQQHGTIDEGFYQQVQDYANSHPMFAGLQMPGAGSGTPAGWSIRRVN